MLAPSEGPAAKIAPTPTVMQTPAAPNDGSSHASGTASPTGDDPHSHVDKRRAHNAVERRYRNSINDRITELRSNLPVNWITGPKAKVRTCLCVACGTIFLGVCT